jgi:hypothetical protein
MGRRRKAACHPRGPHGFGPERRVFGRGAFIITASNDETARVWPAYPDPQELVNVVKERVTRCLTPKQREVLFLSPEPPSWCKTTGKWPYMPATVEAQSHAR